MRFYKHEGPRRLGILLGCLASITWAGFFSWTNWNAWTHVVKPRSEVYISGTTQADLAAQRFDSEIPAGTNEACLVELLAGDRAFKGLGRDAQVAMFVYLMERDSPSLRPIDLEEEGERELAKRLGPRLPLPHSVPFEEEFAQAVAKHHTGDEMPGDGFDRTPFYCGTESSAIAAALDTRTRQRSVFYFSRFLALTGELLAGCIIAFSALYSLVASTEWVIEGFRQKTG
jgi:hypothetical protein